MKIVNRTDDYSVNNKNTTIDNDNIDIFFPEFLISFSDLSFLFLICLMMFILIKPLSNIQKLNSLSVLAKTSVTHRVLVFNTVNEQGIIYKSSC